MISYRPCYIVLLQLQQSDAEADNEVMQVDDNEDVADDNEPAAAAETDEAEHETEDDDQDNDKGFIPTD